MATVKVQWKAWTPSVISTHPQDSNVLYTYEAPLGTDTTSLPNEHAVAPMHGPAYNGHPTDFMFWAGAGSDEPFPLGQIYTLDNNINHAFSPAVVFPRNSYPQDLSNFATVVAWYRGGDATLNPPIACTSMRSTRHTRPSWTGSQKEGRIPSPSR